MKTLKKGDFMAGEEMAGTHMVIGGETISAKDDYLKVITNIFYKINAAADNRHSPEELKWILNFYTDILINSVLDPTDRDNLRTAKEDIYQAECLKRASKPVRSIEDLNNAVSASDRTQAAITACTIIIGEVRNYLDRYFGFETKLAVML